MEREGTGQPPEALSGRPWGASGSEHRGLWKVAWDRSPHPTTVLSSRRGTGSASGSCTTWSCSAAWPWPAAPSSCTRQPSCRTSGGQASFCPALPPPRPPPASSAAAPPAFSIPALGSCRLLLLNQFHDVLTGSCIQLVAEEAMCHYEGELDGLPATVPDTRGGARRMACGLLRGPPKPIAHP